MSATARPASREAGLVFSQAQLLTAVLVFAPLIKGGNRPLPLLVLELAALGLFVFAALRPGEVLKHVSWPMLVTVGALLALPLLQLLPLPDWAWTALPGRDAYGGALQALGMQANGSGVSLLPRATEDSWLTLLPPVAVFLATIAQPDEKVKQLVYLFIGMAIVQAIIGLAQFGTGSVAVLWYVEGLHDRSAIGTYANRDHLAGLLEMALPVALAVLAAAIQRSRSRGSSRQAAIPAGRRIARLFSEGAKGNQMALIGAGCMAILIGIVFSRSRTGLALGMLGILLSTLAFARRMGTERSVRMATIVVAVVVALGAEVGLAPVLARFTELNIGADLRWSMYSGTITGIGEFFPLGSGMGTFPKLFPHFQPGDIGQFVNHAHDDYLEWAFEGGIPVAALILIFLAFYVRRWPQVWRAPRWSRLRYLQVAAGISLLMLGLHGLIDFNLHIPANAIYFAFLAAVFFHREQEMPNPERRQMARSPKSQLELIPPISEPLPEPEDLPNPFGR